MLRLSRQPHLEALAVPHGRELVVVEAEAGEPWHPFVQWSLAQGFCGLENLSLIPGTVGAAPMQKGITDELYWNLLTAKQIVAEGRRQGLNMRFYDPGVRTIRNVEDPRTNWSTGARHAKGGGYALEIHYDAYAPHGIGPGIIPSVLYGFSVLDEALAEEFGGYPYDYRGMLGAPRKGISMLEIGQLEGVLEAGLRDPSQRQATLDRIAKRVVKALRRGLANSSMGGTVLLKGRIGEPVLGSGEEIRQ